LPGAASAATAQRSDGDAERAWHARCTPPRHALVAPRVIAKEDVNMRFRSAAVLLAALIVLTSCSTPPSTPRAHQHAAGSPAPAMLFDDLGRHSQTITTRVPLAQAYFDQGLRLVYGFNHLEAQRAFQGRRASIRPAPCASGGSR
jgi:hypothetical protein